MCVCEGKYRLKDRKRLLANPHSTQTHKHLEYKIGCDCVLNDLARDGKIKRGSGTPKKG